MRQYKSTMKEIKETDKIICNKCGRVIPVVQGVSNKDNQTDHFDLCESCYDELVDSFKIKIDHES